MRSFTSITITLAMAVASKVYALPNALPTYSVVDVDGGANGHEVNGVPAPTTIYKTVTATAASATVTVTATVTPSAVAAANPTTVTESFTVTVYSEHTVTIPADVKQTLTSPVATIIPSSVSVSLDQGSASESETPDYAPTPSPVVSAHWTASISTASYDDGLWHTSYTAKTTEAASQTVAAYDVTTSASTQAASHSSVSSAQPIAASSSMVYRRQVRRP